MEVAVEVGEAVEAEGEVGNFKKDLRQKTCWLGLSWSELTHHMGVLCITIPWAISRTYTIQYLSAMAASHSVQALESFYPEPSQ